MSIVTLTTDFGTRDGYVGAMKGVIARRAPAARIVDIAHDIPPYEVAAGAYCLCQAAPLFPPGTIHVGVVDPGVGTSRRAVVVDDGQHYYVGPDNGLFTWVAPEPRAVYAIESAAFMRGDVSATFHGRDIFAAAAGALAAGARPEDAGPEVAYSPLEQGSLTGVRRDGRGTRWARVVHVDRFGNLITGCRASELPEPCHIELGSGVVIARISRTFGDVKPGELVAYIGSAQTLEIAVRQDSAARILGMHTGDEIAIVATTSPAEVSAQMPTGVSAGISEKRRAHQEDT